jgi:hypothetical protein
MGFFFRILMLAFGGAAIWGAATEEGRGFFGNLFINLGNWLSRTFPGLSGMMGFLAPGQDPDGTQRETFLRNGNMTLLQRGMQQQEVPAEIITAVAENREIFDEFLTTMGPDAVRAISRTPNISTLAEQITPQSLARVMGNPRLAPRILNAATQLGAGGTAPAPGSAAAVISGRVRDQALQLLLNPQHAEALRGALQSNPQLLAQTRPLMRAMAGPGATPFIDALTASPESFLIFADVLRRAGITPEQLLAENGLQSAMTPQILTEMGLRLAAHPEGERLLRDLSRISLPDTEEMAPARAALRLMTPQNISLITSMARDPQAAGLMQMVLPLMGSLRQGAPDMQALSHLLSTYAPQTERLLREFDPSALEPEARESFNRLRSFALTPTQNGRTNLAVMSEALGALRRPDGTLPAAAQEAMQALIAMQQTGISDAERQRHSADLVRASARLISEPGGERALNVLKQLSLSGLPESASRAMSFLTEENMALFRQIAPHLANADDATLGRIMQVSQSIASGTLNANELLVLLRDPNMVTTMGRIMQSLPAEALPATISAQARDGYARARAILLAPARNAEGQPAGTNLERLSTIMRDPVMNTPQGQTLVQNMLDAVVPAEGDTRSPAQRQAALVSSAIAVAALPESATLLQTIGQLNLEGVLGENARALQVLSNHNIPLLQRALASVTPEQRATMVALTESWLSNNAGGAAQEGTNIFSLLPLIQNADMQRLVAQMETDHLPQSARDTIATLRERLCSTQPQRGVNGFFSSILRGGSATPPPGVCLPDTQAPHVAQRSSGPSTISGGMHVPNDVGVVAPPTPSATPPDLLGKPTSNRPVS